MDEEKKQIPLMDHLRELRKRLIWSTIAVTITTVVSFIFSKDIIETLRTRAGEDVNIISIGMAETFVTYFKVAFICGIVFATPFVIFQILMFLKPALTPKEAKYVYTLLPAVLVSFMLGASFAYFIMIPRAADFLLTFGNDIITNEPRFSDYISFVFHLTFAIGLSFELPIVIFFLAKIGFIKVSQLIRFRKFNLVLAFLLAAIITPTPDPVNQTIVAIPLILLYEVGILLARIAQRGRKEPA